MIIHGLMAARAGVARVGDRADRLAEQADRLGVVTLRERDLRQARVCHAQIVHVVEPGVVLVAQVAFQQVACPVEVAGATAFMAIIHSS